MLEVDTNAIASEHDSIKTLHSEGQCFSNTVPLFEKEQQEIRK